MRARRSPGSALKPLIYAMAFDDRSLHPATIVDDVPVRFRDWLPRNFDREHQGGVSVRQALQQSLNVPAVLALEKVGVRRFLATLRAAGTEPLLAPLDRGDGLGVALGSAALSPLEMATLYTGLANEGRFGPLRLRTDRPPPPAPERLLGAAATWYVRDILVDAPVPDGFTSLPAALRDRRVAWKTGTSAGYRDAWAAGYSAHWTVVVWVGHADGTARPGELGRRSALPILLKAFDRLPGENNVPPPPPGDALLATHAGDLPPRLRRLAPAGSDGGPRIAYPPPGATLELAPGETVPLMAQGGEGTLRWLVDGRPLDGARWLPPGAGGARLAVIDEAGRSSAVAVRIVQRP